LNKKWFYIDEITITCQKEVSVSPSEPFNWFNFMERKYKYKNKKKGDDNQ
jgi:hypothetical protein